VVPRLVSTARCHRFEARVQWPTYQARTVEGALFRALLEVDKLASEGLFVQRELPF
jgi:hypothetical protein